MELLSRSPVRLPPSTTRLLRRPVDHLRPVFRLRPRLHLDPTLLLEPRPIIPTSHTSNSTAEPIRDKAGTAILGAFFLMFLSHFVTY